jgi:hypothetical protein
MRTDELYRLSYDASLAVIKGVVPFISGDEDTRTRLFKAVREVPRIIAAEFVCDVEKMDAANIVRAAKMCREICVMLSYCREFDGQFVNGRMCSELIGSYGLIKNKLCEIVGADVFLVEEMKS